METEEQIVYEILNLLNKGELNSDQRISERLLRTFLRTYRADILLTRYYRALTVPDKYYQTIDLPGIKPIALSNEIQYAIPNIINYNNNGLLIQTTANNTIPLINSEEYELGKKNISNKYKAKACIKDNILYIYPGISTENVISSNTPLKEIITKIEGNEITFRAILHNPSDASNYDWTTSIYPVEPEFLKVLKDSIAAKEINILLQTKADQIGDQKDSKLTYHQQGQPLQ